MNYVKKINIYIYIVMPALFLHSKIFKCEECMWIMLEYNNEKNTVRHTSSTFTRVKLCKRLEVNSKPSHLWYDISSVGGMQLLVSLLAPASTRTLAKKTFRNSVYLQIILVTPEAIWSLKLKKKPKFQFVELLKPTCTKLKQKVAINSYLLYWKGKIVNNHKT